MSLMFIRVFAGFLAGLAAGILLMRVTYKKSGAVQAKSNENETAVASRAS